MYPAIEPDIEQRIDEDTPGCVSSFFPRRPGVLVLLGDDDATVLVSAASDMRAFLADRVDIADDRDARWTDLRPVTRRILAYPCGIGMETQWLLARIAMERDPGLLGELLERSAVGLLVFEDEPMRWRVVESTQIDGSVGRWLGPIPRQSTAQRIGEAVDEVFSLCRYPKELALAPRGTPCAYKEMGKCPAACDGSEPLGAYRKRYERAWALIEGGLDAAVELSERAMEEASERLDFEAAGRQKRAVELLGAIPKSETRLTRSLAGMRVLVVTPTAVRGWAGVWAFGEGGLVMIAAIREGAGRVVVAGLIERVSTQIPLRLLDERTVHDLGLVTRVAHAKPGRGHRRVPSVFDLRGAVGVGAVQQAITHASSPGGRDDPIEGT